MGRSLHTRPMRILESPLLSAFRHGFTTRSGGASDPPFDRLNLGGAVGDDPARVAENWALLEPAAAGPRRARVPVRGALRVGGGGRRRPRGGRGVRRVRLGGGLRA